MIESTLIHLSHISILQASLGISLVFAGLLFLGVISIVLDQYTELTIAVTIFLIIWLLVQTLGVNLYVAVFVLLTALLLRLLAATVADTVDSETSLDVTPIIDEFLTDDDTGENRD